MSLMKIPTSIISLFSRFNRRDLGTIGNIYGGSLIICVMIMRTIASTIVHSLSLNCLQILFFESIGALLIIGILWGKQLRIIIKTQKPFLQSAKAISNIIGTYFLFKGLQSLPLAINSVLSLSSTFFGVIGAFLFFMEKPSLNIIFSLILSVFGFILISGFLWNKWTLFLLYPLISALCFSISTLISKRIALFDSVKTSLLWLFLLESIITVIPCALTWSHLLVRDYIRVLCLALLILASIPLTLKAESFASIAFLAPFKCTRVLCSAFFGWLFFSETLSPSMWLGVIAILFSYFILLRNSHRVPSYYILQKGKDVVK